MYDRISDAIMKHVQLTLIRAVEYPIDNNQPVRR